MNTSIAVTPHSFIPEISSTDQRNGDKRVVHKRLIDFDLLELYEHLQRHLHGAQMNSEFSSWTFDISTALGYAVSSSGYLAVIDTKKLNRSVEIYHTPALSKAIWHWRDASIEAPPSAYSYEYLAHGPVKGHGFQTLSLEVAKQAGWYSFLHDYDHGDAQSAFLEVSHIVEAKRLALLFDMQHDKRGELYLFLIIAILSQRCAFSDGDVDIVYEELMRENIKVPGTFMRENWIMTDLIWGGTAHPGRQTIDMLRALVYRHFGERAIGGMRQAAPSMKPAAACPKFDARHEPSDDDPSWTCHTMQNDLGLGSAVLETQAVGETGGW